MPSLQFLQRAMEISVVLAKRVRGLDADTLLSFTRRAVRFAGLRGGLTVRVTSSAEMRKMNRWFREKDKPTDVLSFVAESVPGYAGDIAISMDIAAENAKRLGHPLADEVKVLILHGMLHLAGYDHETDRGEMAERERQLRLELGLPLALTERGATRKRRRRSVAAR